MTSDSVVRPPNAALPPTPTIPVALVIVLAIEADDLRRWLLTPRLTRQGGWHGVDVAAAPGPGR